VLAGLVLAFDQGLDMGGVLDALPTVVATRVRGQHRLAIENAYLERVGDHGQGALHLSWGTE
jgi:hypothetical protein